MLTLPAKAEFIIMADIADETSWYSMIVELNILPFQLHHVIRMISWFFVRHDCPSTVSPAAHTNRTPR